MSNDYKQAVVVDAHMHLYECFDLEKLLDAARENYQKVLSQHQLNSESTSLCLLCADLQDRQFEDALQRLTQVPGYTLCTVASSEPYSRTIFHTSSALQLQVVWGHQIICAENLEVLAFGLSEPVPNGAPLDAVIAALGKASFGILPWGFGKWSGHRGQLVTQLLNRSLSGNSQASWWVGDNGGRLAMTSVPKQIRHAATLGRWNIPGSDPLPFPDQVSKVVSCGAILRGHYNPERPLASLHQLLDDTDEQPVVFGQFERLSRFLRVQLGMQWRKRIRRSGSQSYR